MSREDRETQAGLYDKLCGLLDDLHEVMVEFRRHVNTINSILLQGANRVTVDVAAGSSSGKGQNPTFSANALLGWSLREPTGLNPATLVLRDGSDSSGDEVASVQLLAGKTTGLEEFAPGISLINGLYLDCTAGEITGAVFLRNT